MLKNKEFLSEDIEMDEVFFGGSESNKHLYKKNINEQGNTKNSSVKTTLICLKSRDSGNIIINAEKDRKMVNVETGKSLILIQMELKEHGQL